ncbi:class I SAM-dependent methyltransferase [Daejeonella sp.]|uniref:class I SAM-dependent methyltransferase n=1 Tax=Daejeonella sp. TaxID=2805397 RepID=UPI0027B92DE2|nr:class I SAM-dependent methyltransferase [Daejeonella sp.]
MHTLKPCILLFTFLSLSMFSVGQDRYTIKTGDPNGIKKWYMGRQIAQVMSHYGIDWLEREEREREENTTLLLKNLAVKPGMVIADIGAGSGYHSALLSKMVGSGKVFAVDVEPEMIAYLNERIKQKKLSRIVPVLSTEQKVSLPENTIDIMLLVDVYHEFSYPYEMALSMRSALKPGGKLVLVEFRSEDSTVPIKTIHKMSEAQAIKEFKAAGFKFDKNIDNLPWQHCMVFTKQ